jgi:hypothetical protein
LDHVPKTNDVLEQEPDGEGCAMAYRRDVFAYWGSRLKPANAIEVSFLLGQPLLKGGAQMLTK